MRISERGVNLIKAGEGLELQAYPDPGTGGAPFTIGHGHTGPDVHPGMTITKERAEDLLRQDLARFEEGVSRLVNVPLDQNEFDALVSFAFNVGLQNLASSTLLILLNKGDKDKAAAQFGRWTKANGHELPGLVKRRNAEAALFRGRS